MKELPADLADPLHLLTPTPGRDLLGPLAVLLTLALLAWLWRRFRRRASASGSVPRGRPVASSAVEKAIQSIYQRYLDSDRRQGCHELSATLREHLESGQGRPFTTWTSGEITARLGDLALSRFFDLLSDLQFGRQDPSPDDFEGICELARDVMSVAGKPQTSA